jgi:ssRNA-specific RNase YbeY (16S rRNA maturation enzyme)
VDRAAANKIKNAVLGKRYDLSLAFLSERQMRAAMKFRYKKISGKKTSNVLSFPLSKNSGEILICKKAAAPFSVGFLFIHGCLHLRGLRHGATMERKENQLLKKFGFQRLAASS